jgi:hypothetical protein
MTEEQLKELEEHAADLREASCADAFSPHITLDQLESLLSTARQAEVMRRALEGGGGEGKDHGLDHVEATSCAVAGAETYRDVLAYAQQLATVAASHYGPPPGWKPLDDLWGVLSQIDNALTGLTAATTKAKGRL